MQTTLHRLYYDHTTAIYIASSSWKTRCNVYILVAYIINTTFNFYTNNLKPNINCSLLSCIQVTFTVSILFDNVPANRGFLLLCYQQNKRLLTNISTKLAKFLVRDKLLALTKKDEEAWRCIYLLTFQNISEQELRNLWTQG